MLRIGSAIINDWNATQYDRFGDDRQQAARDLLQAVTLTAPAAIADLGCGSGLSTELLRNRYPDAQITGIDTSPNMLKKAAARVPDAVFAEGDLARFEPAGPLDLIYANASFHWVGDHAQLFPRLLQTLSVGGQLAVQMPDNLHEPSHRLMRDVVGESPFREATAGHNPDRNELLSPSEYFDVLASAGARVRVWRTLYFHELDSVQAIADWFSTTGLKPYLDALPENLRAAYRQRYEEELAEAYPCQQNGHVLMGMPRLFIVAQRLK